MLDATPRNSRSRHERQQGRLAYLTDDHVPAEESTRPRRNTQLRRTSPRKRRARPVVVMEDLDGRVRNPGQSCEEEPGHLLAELLRLLTPVC
jgi:hypothetical protein